MSRQTKRHIGEKASRQEEYVDRDLPVQQDVAAIPIDASRKNEVPRHRQCPLCYGNWGGVGVAFKTLRNRRYYRCQTCGHNYWYDFVRHVIEFTE